MSAVRPRSRSRSRGGQVPRRSRSEAGGRSSTTEGTRAGASSRSSPRGFRQIPGSSTSCGWPLVSSQRARPVLVVPRSRAQFPIGSRALYPCVVLTEGGLPGLQDHPLSMAHAHRAAGPTDAAAGSGGPRGRARDRSRSRRRGGRPALPRGAVAARSQPRRYCVGARHRSPFGGRRSAATLPGSTDTRGVTLRRATVSSHASGFDGHPWSGQSESAEVNASDSASSAAATSRVRAARKATSLP